MNTYKKRRMIIIILALIFVLFILIGFLQPLSVTYYEYRSMAVPKAFNGFKIVQLSDFHCKAFGENEAALINKVKNLSPDLIVLTGDMVDETHSTDNLDYLLCGIADIAPIYAILGNHDNIDQDAYDNMLALFEQYDVNLLYDTMTTLSKDDSKINIYGSRFSNWPGNCIKASTEGFNLLLYHDANAFPVISEFGFDVILSGHTHGGIIRLPLIGGLIGNDRKPFPKYASGKFVNTDTDCTMFTSRGLGDSSIPRFYNPPEIVLLTLYSE